MFVQLTRPPLRPRVRVPWSMDSGNRVFDDVIIPFAWNLILQSMTGNCLFLSNLSSLIKNSSNIFSLFFRNRYVREEECSVQIFSRIKLLLAISGNIEDLN